MKRLNMGKVKEYALGTGIFLVITLGFYWYLFRNFDMIFGINDDWTMYMVLSGSYLGKPDAHVTFILYPLAWLIATLYEITNKVPWYGLLSHGGFILGGFFLTIRVFERISKRIIRVLLSSLMLLVYYMACINVLVTIQFTHVGTIFGATAVFLFITSDTKDKNWKQILINNIPTLICILLSVGMRYNAAFMCIPVGGMLFLAKVLWENEKISLNSFLKYAGFLAVTGVSVILMFVIHSMAYSSEEWQEYESWNKYRAQCADYYGFPSYEDMEEYVHANGMTREEFEISKNIYNFYQGEAPASEMMKKMAETAEAKYKSENPFSKVLNHAKQTIVNSFTNQEIKPLNGIVVLLAILLFVLGIFNPNRKIWIVYAFYLFGRMFAWYFILFQGRFPIRIEQSLFLIDLMAVMAMIVQFSHENMQTENVKKMVQNISVAAVIMAVAIVFLQGKNQIKTTCEYIEIFQDRWYGIKEYCMEHEENRYLLNGASYSLYYFSDSVLDTNTIGQFQNYYANSNFFSMSPAYYEMADMEIGCDVAEELLEQGNNYWIYEQGRFSEEVPVVQYYSYKYDTFSYELVDTFETETSSFEVYHFSK